MKSTDIAAAAMIAIASTAIAYFLGNALLGDPNDEQVIVTYMEPIVANIAQPDPEVFNTKAINPTVEVFVGNCDEDEVLDPVTNSCVSIKTLYEVEITYTDKNNQSNKEETGAEEDNTATGAEQTDEEKTQQGE